MARQWHAENRLYCTSVPACKLAAEPASAIAVHLARRNWWVSCSAGVGIVAVIFWSYGPLHPEPPKTATMLIAQHGWATLNPRQTAGHVGGVAILRCGTAGRPCLASGARRRRRHGLDGCHDHLYAVLDEGSTEVIFYEFRSAPVERVHRRVMHTEHGVLEFL